MHIAQLYYCFNEMYVKMYLHAVKRPHNHYSRRCDYTTAACKKCKQTRSRHVKVGSLFIYF